MGKSIETIWKEGFLKSDALVAPKLNDLYNQKSKHLVDRLKRMFKINLLAIILFAVALLVASVLAGLPYIGAALFLMHAVIVLISKKQLNAMEKIDESENSYQYLKTFDKWLKDSIAAFTRIYKFFYPVLFLTIIPGVWFSSYGEAIMNKIIRHYPDTYVVNGIPLFWVLGTLLFPCLMAFFSDEIYKLDIRLVYGRVFKKLEEIIADMEELKSP